MAGVLLIQTASDETALGSSAAGSENLGLEYLAAACAGAGVDCHLVDLIAASTSSDVLSAALATRPDVVGLSPTSMSALSAVEITHRIQSEFPSALTVWGGHLATGMAQSGIEASSMPDCLALGMFERALPSLAISWAENHEIPAFSQIRVRPKMAECLSEAPSLDDAPSWDQFAPLRMLPKETYSTNGARVLTAVGCAQSCNFCTTQLMTGSHVHYRDSQSVVSEIRDLRDNLGVRRIWFNDDSMLRKGNESLRRCLEILEGVARPHDVLSYRMLARCDAVLTHQSSLERLKRLGLREVFMGVESSEQSELDSMGKRLDSDTAADALHVLADAGIVATIGFMMFTPESSVESLRDKAGFLLRVDQAHRVALFCKALVGFPGTPTWDSWDAEGRVDLGRSTPFLALPLYSSEPVATLARAFTEIERVCADADRHLLLRLSSGEVEYRELRARGELNAAAFVACLDLAASGANAEALCRDFLTRIRR